MEVKPTQELKKNLTVRPVENALGIRSPSFRVWQEGSTKGTIRIPMHHDSVSAADRAAACSNGSPARMRFTGTLRSHQVDAVERGREAFARVGGGVLSLDVGLGKTVCALALAAHTGRRTMIVVHKGFLADQWVERIQQFCPGATIGRIQQDAFDVEKDFVIAMIQTLCVRPWPADAFRSIGTVIVDEAHHIAAQAFSQAMFLFRPRYTLGLTATPERKDGLTRLLYWFMGPEFYRLQRKEQDHVSVRRVPFTCDAFLEAPPVTNFGKLNFAELVNQLTRIPERNALLVRLISESPGKHILVLTDRREHASWLVKNLSSAALYIGGMGQDALDTATKSRVVVGTFSLAQEGLDIPTLDTIFLVTPHSDVKQAIGRVLRGASRPVIWDVVDSWSVLYSMWRKRLATYRELGIAVEGEQVVKARCLLGDDED
jgi:superfamily II DNA or RNA helicase